MLFFLEILNKNKPQEQLRLLHKRQKKKILIHYDYYNLPNTGIILSLWLIAVAKFTDVGALIIGQLFGKKKFMFIDNLSPISGSSYSNECQLLLDLKKKIALSQG